MYVFDSRIRYSEVDEHGLLRPESLINYFQDCSTFQSEDGDIGIGYLKDRHMGWIVSYWQIEIARMPALREKVTIGTIPYDMKGGFLGLRNFFMDTEAGERVAVANSVWALMDIDRMMPVKEPPEMELVYRLEEKLDMSYLSRKVQMPKGETPEEKKCVQIAETDLDSNHHVNNARYVRFAMGIIPESLFISGIRVEYKKQVLLGERIHILVYPRRKSEGSAEEEWIIPIEMRSDDGTTYCTMELKARARKELERDAFMRG